MTLYCTKIALYPTLNVQRLAKAFVRGCEKFVTALAYLFCLALVGSCLARFAYFLANLCSVLQVNNTGCTKQISTSTPYVRTVPIFMNKNKRIRRRLAKLAWTKLAWHAICNFAIDFALETGKYFSVPSVTHFG